VRPERFELPAFWFVARRSIQLSYGRTIFKLILILIHCPAYCLHPVWFPPPADSNQLSYGRTVNEILPCHARLG
jgi:hypothetical protein